MFGRLASHAERNGTNEIGDALLVVDPLSGALLFLNPTARQLFGITDVSAAGGPERLIAELADLTPREFITHLNRAEWTVEVAVRIEPLLPGPYNTGGAIGVTIRRTDASAIGHGSKRVERLQSLWDLAVRRGFGGAEQVRAILNEGVAGVGLEQALLGRIDGDQFHVAFTIEMPDVVPGEPIPLARSPAREAIRRAGTFAVLDAEAGSPQRGDLYLGMRSFLASAFRVGEEQWAVVFGSVRPRATPFDEDDWDYIDHLNEALSWAIERRESEARIEQLAYSDTLTNLPNRAALLGRLDETIAEAQALSARAAVLFVDIDGFKAVNDSVGHRGGDHVLAEIAGRLRSTLRREEFIGRLGGDEFAIIMSHAAGRTQIESIAQRFASVLTNPFTLDGHRFALSASIGVAIYPDDATTRDELLAAADAAMYQAKAEGGSRIRFHSGGDTSIGDAGSTPFIATDGDADSPKSTSYLLTYQPVVDTAGAVLAAEALIRRVDPRHGLLAPEHGWSIMRDEETRRAIDRWVLHEAVSQARAFGDITPDLRIDVNLAAYDPREIEALFSDAVLEPDLERIRIEIAASQFVQPSDEFLAFVERCVTSRIGFVLDRFDGGLATLQSLAHLPVRAIKLDRSLVEALEQGTAARALIEGTVIVARSLGWLVVAKGVETQRQQELLVTLGVDGVQGFQIAHPMTAIVFGNWLRERRSSQGPDA